jgi:hypothetical protein
MRKPRIGFGTGGRRQGDGVATYRYSGGEVNEALKRAGARQDRYFRESGRLSDRGAAEPDRRSEQA